MKINLITTCAGKKEILPPNNLKFRNLPYNDVYNEWINRLSNSSIHIPALDLYKGGYWNVIKDISSKVDNIYILSAGYGVIKSNTPISSYSVGFKPDNEDYVGHKGFNTNEWWNLINGDKLSKLINDNPDEKFILYVSFSYMKAIKDDILKAISSPNLYIFSPDTKGRDFEPYLLQTSLKMRHLLGGNTMNITALTIKYFLENINTIGWDKNDINQHFHSITKDLPDVFGNRVYDFRKKIDDKHIIKLILEIDPELKMPPKKVQENIWNKGFKIGPNRMFRILDTLKKEANEKTRIK